MPISLFFSDIWNCNLNSTPNERAFLSMLSVSEGTDNYGTDQNGIDNGYRVIYGSTHSHPNLFSSFKDHPRQYIHANDFTSSAAGRYQILAHIFDSYKSMLSLPDFGPESQDLIALRLITECRALNDINTGNFDEAVHKCRSRWASLPGAGYKQREQKMSDLRVAFVEHGGQIV